MNDENRSRAERTTRSARFDWIEDYNGGLWHGLRNAMVLMTITHLSGNTYELNSRLTGNTGFSKTLVGLKRAQDEADKLFEDWAHAMGLKVGDEWWKENRG